jgi:hypothetical protein
MSKPSPDRNLGPLRDLRDDELFIINKMISVVSLRDNLRHQLSSMRVQDMPDAAWAV